MPTNNIDYIPHQPFTNGSFDHIQQQLMRAQRQKWFVLLGTFLLVFMLASLWVWTRPAIYSSQAVLLFTFPAQTELEFSELVQRKVEAHQQKLLSQ
ncbi:hypothetical protein RS130_04770 [Paraglaciecola aquimarina]|uniref:Polysaccharide chain length determinant N-terminal domain-containing protein n=1 Tax=Paraglaciecola aquimarina TaxID=1235557 RepID=A0ABU3STK7_9ALTE|nr:hypothetical protein [Paraglaciecola aquimarina]MDU0353335.1 hypothetical protein [Paraglaciecola aquimarina]